MEDRVKQIIQLWDELESRAANFRSLYQEVANLMFPQDNQITRKTVEGENKMDAITDTTAVMAGMEMASGLSQNLVAPGQRFFTLRAANPELSADEAVKHYLSVITDITHEHLFTSNFLLQLNETLRSLCVFGTSALYSEYTTELNFRDYDIGSFLIMENSKGRVDTIQTRFHYTPRQAFQEWGPAIGKQLMDALDSDKKAAQKYEFLHTVRPRTDRNPTLADNMNMPFESVYVSLTDKIIVGEGGFQEFPFHVARWTKCSNEVFGRGQGTFVLPEVRMLQLIRRTFVEVGNKHALPPVKARDTFPGTPNLSPGAVNRVQDMDDIEVLYQTQLGSYGNTKDILEMQQELVRKAFYNDIFAQLANLKGDRRTTVEIRERIGEGLQRLGPPVGRIQEELFNPLISRVVLLLLRNGRFPTPPRQLEGADFKIEYVGRLAMELKSQQARGGQVWMINLAELEEAYPGITDNADADSFARRLGETLGANPDDIASIEEVEAKREARMAQLQAEQAAQMAQMASQAYGQTTGAPEEGSPAGELMAAAKG